MTHDFWMGAALGGGIMGVLHMLACTLEKHARWAAAKALGCTCSVGDSTEETR